MENSEQLEKRIRQLELTVLAQKACIQTLYGATLARVYSEDSEFLETYNEQFNKTLISFMRTTFNKAKISPEDYDSFINSAKVDFKPGTDFSEN